MLVGALDWLMGESGRGVDPLGVILVSRKGASEYARDLVGEDRGSLESFEAIIAFGGGSMA